MRMDNRPSKRPPGWSKPYWARVGLYTIAMLVSFAVSLILVRFGCGVVLRAAIPAPPIAWRVTDMVLDALICGAVTWYFASREGYDKRTADGKACVGGGFLFLLVQCPVAILCGGAAFAAGPLASTLARLIHFGNQSIYVDSMDSPPLLLVLGCMAVADVCVLIPAMAIGERMGAVARQKEIAAIQKEARQK